MAYSGDDDDVILVPLHPPSASGLPSRYYARVPKAVFSARDFSGGIADPLLDFRYHAAMDRARQEEKADNERYAEWHRAEKAAYAAYLAANATRIIDDEFNSKQRRRHRLKQEKAQRKADLQKARSVQSE